MIKDTTLFRTTLFIRRYSYDVVTAPHSFYTIHSTLLRDTPVPLRVPIKKWRINVCRRKSNFIWSYSYDLNPRILFILKLIWSCSVWSYSYDLIHMILFPVPPSLTKPSLTKLLTMPSLTKSCPVWRIRQIRFFLFFFLFWCFFLGIF